MNLPNKLTMLRIILIPVFLVLVLVDRIPMHYLWSLIVFLAACITDTLDGNIARKRNLVTDFGKLMDPLADKLLVMSALVAFIPVAGVPVWVVVVILGREFMVTSLRLIAAGKGVVIAADKWGKVKTISQMVWLNYTLLMLWQMQQISHNHQHDDEQQRQKADKPIHIHEFMSRKLFQIADCYQVGAAA